MYYICINSVKMKTRTCLIQLDVKRRSYTFDLEELISIALVLETFSQRPFGFIHQSICWHGLGRSEGKCSQIVDP